MTNSRITYIFNLFWPFFDTVGATVVHKQLLYTAAPSGYTLLDQRCAAVWHDRNCGKQCQCYRYLTTSAAIDVNATATAETL
jgi:hypothetical protein